MDQGPVGAAGVACSAPDAPHLLPSSPFRDGYCSILAFDEGELGEPLALG
jgi:hypothetical protein